MKTKFKILALASAATAIMPSAMIAASCSCAKDYKAQAETIKEDTLKEFVELSKIYRPTFHTRKICDYLKNRIKELGFDAVEDDYRDSRYSDSAGNLTFEIPASNGYENFPKIIVQAHMDMVCNLATGSESYDWKNNGVKVVRENYEDPENPGYIVDAIHSEGFKTSLGADDGIGIGIILSLTKNRNSFTHGPLRFIITADEEAGDSGAKSVSNEWLDAPYVLNVDSYQIGTVLVSCQGASEFRFERAFEPFAVPANTKQYHVAISGLKYPRHSGLNINQGLINAIQSMAGLINFIDINTPGYVAYLTSSLSKYDYGTIPADIELDFAINEAVTFDQLEKIVDDYEEYSKLMHPAETGYTATITEVDTNKATYCLNADDTRKIIQFVNIVPFGAMNFDTKSGAVVTSCNMAGVPNAHIDEKTGELTEDSCFAIEYRKDPKTSTDKMMMAMGIQGRSSNPSELGSEPTPTTQVFTGFYSLLVNLAEYCFGEGSYRNDLTSIGWVPPWPIKDSKMVDVIMDASREFKQTMYKENVQGWAETGWFAQHKPEIQMACIGPEAHGEHDPTSWVEVPSIKQEIEYMLYAFDKIKAKE